MAFKCTRACYSGRLYEEGFVYDSIGTAQPRFFEEVESDNAVETGGLVEVPAEVEAPADTDDESTKSEREQVFEALDTYGVLYKKNASTDSLKELLMETQNKALES